MEKDAILICYENIVKIVTMDGTPRQSKKLVSHLEFDFPVENIGKENRIICNFYIVYPNGPIINAHQLANLLYFTFFSFFQCVYLIVS